MVYAKIAAIVFTVDEFIKDYFETTGKAGENLPAFGGKVLFTKSHNKGAMLNLGEKKQKTMALISVIFTVFMLGIFVATLGLKGRKMLKTGLALLLGGAFSNTYDRLVRKYVVDYVSFNVKNEKIRKVVFNISDFAIIIGSLCFVISALFEKE